MICSDPDLIKFGVTKKVTDVLDEAGLAYEIYSNIKANPTIENVQKGVEAFMAAGADYLIAIAADLPWYGQRHACYDSTRNSRM